MQIRPLFFGIVAALAATGASSLAQQSPNNTQQTPSIIQGTLIESGSVPFHLKATITEGHDLSPVAKVEIYWVAADQWRRTIESSKFSQILIVDGVKVFEQDSDSYFPLGLETLVTAMVDPKPLLDAYRPDNRLLTKANGASSESGSICFDSSHRICLSSQYGLMESVGVAGHSVDFMRYKEFHGKRIARRLVYTVSVGDFLTAQVTELKELDHPNDGLFTIDQPTPREKQIHSVSLQEAELRDLAVEEPEIIWPQALDGAITGKATFYLAIDRQGKLREVHPLETANERSNDSAIRQIMKWKFKQPIKDGVPVQAEGVMTFDLNTRAWGPKDILSDAEVRKLATNIVEPVVKPGTVPPDSVYKLWMAVDSDGIVIEQIAAGGPSQLAGPCGQALKQWHFSPLLENGQPRPYRAQVVFHIK